MELLTIFENISGWFTGLGITAILGIVVTIFRKRGWMPYVINITRVGAKVTQEIGEAFLESSDVFEAADAAISDNGNLKENSIKDVIKEGKEAILAWKDVIVIIKPVK